MTARGSPAFARAIAARYSRRPSMRALRIVLRRHPIGLIWQHQTHAVRPQLHLAVHIDARVVRHQASSATRLVVATPAPLLAANPRQSAGDSTTTPARPLAMSTDAGAPGMTRVGMPLSWPTRNIPLVRAPAVGGRAPTQRADANPLPARVLRHAATSPSGRTGAGDVPVFDSTAPVMFRRPVSSAENATKPASAPLDMRALTDQVIRTIDQRIAAQRERMGRI